MLPHAPGVQVQAIPEDGAVIEDSEAEDKINPDERLPQRDLDKRIQHGSEFSDSEDEGEGGRRDNRSFKVISMCTSLHVIIVPILYIGISLIRTRNAIPYTYSIVYAIWISLMWFALFSLY